jgi:mRNA interferase MazF
VVVVPLTSNARRAALPGTVELTADETGLPKTSVAMASLVTAVDKDQLLERAGRLPARQVRAVLRSLDVVLGR